MPAAESTPLVRGGASSPRPSARAFALAAFLALAATASLVATLGLYAYLEPLNDWRPQFESTYALMYGPHMLVGLTPTPSTPSSLAEPVHRLRGSPDEVTPL